MKVSEGRFYRPRVPLTPKERATLANLEAAVTRGVRAFALAGRDLTAIRDKQLYRETHNSFESYIAARWKMSRQQAQRLIEADALRAALEKLESVPVAKAA